MNASPEYRPVEDPHDRPSARRPPKHRPPEEASPETHRPDLAGPPSDEANPFWTPPGLDLTGWSPAQRAQVAAIVNPIYRGLVLSARSALAKSTGLTIVHLLWLEILDQMELAAAKPDADLLEVAMCEFQNRSRRQIIDRHLRTVQAKLKASDLLVRLKDLKRKSRSLGRRTPDDNIPDEHVPPFFPHAPRRPKHGKNDFC